MRYPALVLTPEDAMSLEGLTVIAGLPGSGKTTSSYAYTLRALLDQRPRLGGLILAPTRAHVTRAVAMIEAARRGDDLILMKAHRHKFNFLQWGIHNRFSIESLVAMLLESAQVAGRTGTAAAVEHETYWQRAAEGLIRSSLYLATLAQDTLCLLDLHNIVTTAPNKGEPERAAWKASSFCYALLERARARVASSRHHVHHHNLKMVEDFFLRAWANLNDRTKTSVVNTLSTTLNPLLFGELYEMFSTTMTFDLSWTLDHRHKIVVADLPVEDFGGEASLYVQTILKYCWQLAVRRRPIARHTVPAFLVVDEAQLYATAADLHFFAAFARNKGAIVVYVLHSQAELYDKLGRSAGETLLSYARNFMLHALDLHTARFASELIGQAWLPQLSRTASTSTTVSGPFGLFWNAVLQWFGEYFGISTGTSVTTGEKYAYRIEPSAFTSTLKTGGPENRYLVDIIVFQHGRQWSTGANFLKVTLPQDLPRPRLGLRSLLGR